jgi:tetratricopeptide (TPR) repeat protein
MRSRLYISFALLVLLNACVAAPQSAQLLQSAHESPLSAPVNLTHIPFFPQEEYQCGPAALATLLQASAINASPDDLVSRVYVPARQGSLQVEMLAAPRAYGRLSYQLEPSLVDVLEEVRNGRPVLVMQNLALSWYPQWHYAVVVGYDLHKGELLLRSGTTREYKVAIRVFERTWRRSEHWAMVVLEPGEMPLNADELRFFEALTAMERVHAGEGISQWYQAGLERWPASPPLAMGLGNLHYSAGRFDQAGELYSRLLESHPDYAIAHNNLAQVMLRQGRREDALQHAQRAVELGGRFAEMYQATLVRAREAE